MSGPVAFCDDAMTIVDGPEVADVWVARVDDVRPLTWCWHCQRRHGGLLVVLSQDLDTLEWLEVVQFCGEAVG